MNQRKIAFTEEKRICPECKKEVIRADMLFTKDCHGFPFRLVCWKCYDRIMTFRHYDGAFYTELDERLEPDY